MGGLDRRSNRPLEPVAVELGLVPVELLSKSSDGVSVQRVGRLGSLASLTREILEDPPKFSQMPEIVVQSSTP